MGGGQRMDRDAYCEGECVASQEVVGSHPFPSMRALYLFDVLLKHAQLKALVEAELAVLPRVLQVMVTLQQEFSESTPQKSS